MSRTRKPSHFGELPLSPIGTLFPDRKALSEAGVHRPPVAGICGTATHGAESIVLSGGYEDDEDHGDVVIYTGHGGRDPTTGKQIADQQLERQNHALARSMHQGLPVRLIRGASHRSRFSPPSGYRYDGEYFVDSYWHEQGRAGHRVWRFRLVRQSGSSGEYALEEHKTLALGNPAPRRSTSSVTRIIRDTAMSRKVKELYDHRCQVCGVQLIGPGGPYAEGAHIRPLGRPHNGPDNADNLLCLCPNHHFLFDVGAFGIQESFELIGISGKLNRLPSHRIDKAHLQYHLAHFGFL